MKTTLTSLILGLLSLLIGCITAPPLPVLSEPIVHQVADLTISLRYIDEETLIARHGKNDARIYTNPYYGYPAILTKKRLLVFEFNASTIESEVLFKLNEITLRIGSVSADSKSRPYLMKIWNHYRLADTTSMDLKMQKTILKREFAVKPNEPVSGYLVFGSNYPEEGGDGLISMYVSTPDGDKGTIEIPLSFNADGKPGDSSKGSGIFSDE